MVALRLGVLGLSPGNGHPFSFSAIVNGYDPAAFAAAGWPAILDYLEARPRRDFGFEGVAVTCAWTPDPAVTARLCAACRIPQPLAEPEELLGRVDAVLLLRDDAESHLPLGLPFLDAGLPLFIDKPLTLEPCELARFRPHLESGRLMSCAGLRFATELDGLRRQPEQLGRLRRIEAAVVNDWPRYGIHMLDALLGLGLPPPHRLRRAADRPGRFELVLADGTPVTLDCLGPGPRRFDLCFVGERGRLDFDLADNFGAFRRLLGAFLDQVRSGRPAIPAEQTLASVRTVIAGLGATGDAAVTLP